MKKKMIAFFLVLTMSVASVMPAFAKTWDKASTQEEQQGEALNLKNAAEDTESSSDVAAEDTESSADTPPASAESQSKAADEGERTEDAVEESQEERFDPEKAFLEVQKNSEKLYQLMGELTEEEWEKFYGWMDESNAFLFSQLAKYAFLSFAANYEEKDGEELSRAVFLYEEAVDQYQKKNSQVEMEQTEKDKENQALVLLLPETESDLYSYMERLQSVSKVDIKNILALLDGFTDTDDLPAYTTMFEKNLYEEFGFEHPTGKATIITGFTNMDLTQDSQYQSMTIEDSPMERSGLEKKLDQRITVSLSNGMTYLIPVGWESEDDIETTNYDVYTYSLVLGKDYQYSKELQKLFDEDTAQVPFYDIQVKVAEKTLADNASTYTSYWYPASGTILNFTCVSNGGYALNCADNTVVNGSNAMIWSAGNDSQQMFQAVNTGDGWYYLFQESSGKVLDVTGGSAANGVNLQFHTYNGSAGQKFAFEKIDGANGQYRIKSRLGTYVNVYLDTYTNGRNVNMASDSGKASARWRINIKNARRSGYYYPTLADAINNAVSGETVYVTGSHTSPAIWETNKSFTVKPSGGSYTVTESESDGKGVAGFFRQTEGSASKPVWTFSGNGSDSLTINGNQKGMSGVISAKGAAINLKSGFHITNGIANGIWCESGIINMEGNASIYSNKQAGIATQSATIHMSGGSIYSNGTRGIGAVNESGIGTGARITITGGSIYKNAVYGILAGGSPGGILSIKNAAIYNNSGKGVCLEGGAHTANLQGGCAIHSNKDGVYIGEGGTLNITGGEIFANTAHGMINYGMATISGGTNYGNGGYGIANYKTLTVNNNYGMGYTSWTNTSHFTAKNNGNGNIYNHGICNLNTDTGYLCFAHTGRNYNLFNDSSGTMNLKKGTSSAYYTAMGGNADYGIYNKGALTFQKGTILNAKTGVYNTGTFTMSSTATIQSATTRGVYNSGTFYLNGGTITDCSSNAGGAGVLTSGTFHMSGGTIKNNRTLRSTNEEGKGTGDGAGIHIGDNSQHTSSFTMTGGTISNNTSARTGGAIRTQANTVTTITNGTISGNTAASSGGAILNAGSAALAIRGGTISGNRAQAGGGAVASDGTISMTGGTISGNTAATANGIYHNGEALYLGKNPVIAGTDDIRLGKGKFVTVKEALTAVSGVIATIAPVSDYSNGRVVVRVAHDSKNAEFDYSYTTGDKKQKFSLSPANGYVLRPGNKIHDTAGVADTDIVLSTRYTVDYNGNSDSYTGSVPAGGFKYWYETTKVASDEMSGKGLLFLGWNEDSKSATRQYNPGDAIAASVNKNLTLYAIWQKGMKIVYMSTTKGVTTGMKKEEYVTQAEVAAAGGYTVKKNKNYTNFAKSGYTFNGWGTKANELERTTEYSEKETVKLSYTELENIADGQRNLQSRSSQGSLRSKVLAPFYLSRVSAADGEAVKTAIFYDTWDEPPSIHGNDSKEFYEGTTVTRADLLKDVTAEDQEDKDVTDQIIITRIVYAAGRLNAAGKDGEYTKEYPSGMPENETLDTWFLQLDQNDSPVTHHITYRVTDSAGNTTVQEHMVKVNYNEFPVITTEDRYYTLEEAKSGMITEEELLQKSFEDGSLAVTDKEEDALYPDTIEGKTRLIGFDPQEWKNFSSSGYVTLTYSVKDSMGPEGEGKETLCQFKVVVAEDGEVPEISPETRYVRMINQENYNKNAGVDYTSLTEEEIARKNANGGLHVKSKWYTEEEYKNVITSLFARATPKETWIFTKEDVDVVKAYIDAHGIGNAKESTALDHFYTQFKSKKN